MTETCDFLSLQELNLLEKEDVMIVRQATLKLEVLPFKDSDASLTKEKDPKDQAPQSHEVEFVKMKIKNIRRETRGKKSQTNTKVLAPCHSCRQLIRKSNLAKCSEKECGRFFCALCIYKRYKASYDEVYNIFHDNKWNCFSCKAICNCKICKSRYLNHEMKASDISILDRKPSKSSLTFETTGEYKTPLMPKLEKHSSEPSKGQRYRFSETQRKPRKIKKCHLCRVSYLTTEMANCSLPNCPNSYCPDCIKETFSGEFDLKKYNPELWICYACGKTCKCERCLRAPTEDIPDMIRKPRAPKRNDLIYRKPRSTSKGKKRQKKEKAVKKPKPELPVQRNSSLEDLALGKHKPDAPLEDKTEKKVRTGEIIENIANKADLKILEEVNIDFGKKLDLLIKLACFTLYEAQNEEELQQMLKK